MPLPVGGRTRGRGVLLVLFIGQGWVEGEDRKGRPAVLYTRVEPGGQAVHGCTVTMNDPLKAIQSSCRGGRTRTVPLLPSMMLPVMVQPDRKEGSRGANTGGLLPGHGVNTLPLITPVLLGCKKEIPP